MTRLGYLVPEWPAQTHMFFWRELTALRALGNCVTVFSTRKPPADVCRHEFAREARATTRYLFPPRPRQAARVLATRPRNVARALAYIATLPETPAKGKARLLGLLLCAADLAAWCEELGIEQVHAHSCADAAHIVALCKRLGGPGYSLTLHGDLPVYGCDHVAKMREARFIAPVTRPLQEEIVRATGIAQERLPVIWMGVDTDRFTPADPIARDPSQFLVVTVARLHPAKGHFFVLEAMQRLRQAGIGMHYAIAGEGPFRRDIESRVAELGLGNSVHMLGTLGESEVLALLQRADCSVLASTGLGEAAPVSVMEAMSCGLPVVVSRIGGTADMIRHEEDGILIEQEDVDALAAALTRLARDPQLRARLGGNARRKAVGEFDYRTTARKLHDALARPDGVEEEERSRPSDRGDAGRRHPPAESRTAGATP